MIQIRKQYLESLQDYIQDLIDCNPNDRMAFEIPDEWICHKQCTGCEFNFVGVECQREDK